MSVAALFAGVNWFAVVALTLAGFLLGALWHAPFLFGKAWSRESRWSEERRPKPLLVFGLSGLLNFVAVVGLAIFIGPTVGAVVGLLWGLVIAILWLLPTFGSTYLFAGRSLALFAIDAGFYLVYFGLCGLLIGLWH
jgi:hypothetical protein